MTTTAPQQTKRQEHLLPRLLACALACAQAHFRAPDAATLTAAHYLLTGKYDVWSGYPALKTDDQRRLARMLRHRDNDVANDSSFRSHAVEQLEQDKVPGVRLLDDREHVRFHHGIAPRAFADRLLDEMDTIAAEGLRPQPIALAGEHTNTLNVPMAQGLRAPILASYTFGDEHVPEHRPPALPLATAEDLPEAVLDISEFLSLSSRLDDKSRTAFREQTLRPFFERMRDRNGRRLEGKLELRAGPTQVLSAPTGSGKSVMMRGTATWALESGLTLAIVVDTNSAALKITRQIEEDLEASGALTKLGLEPGEAVVPLMSPNSLARELERTVRNSKDRDYVDWVFARIGYSCQLPALAAVDEEVDTWSPGSEPCRNLAPVRPPRQDDYRTMPQPKVCPFRQDCGKFRLTRTATTARIIVTTHANLHQGRMHIPLELADGTVSERVSVEELILRRCQIVVIDELDAFQSTVLAHAGRGLTLAWGDRSHDRPLLDMDGQLVAAFHRLPGALEERARLNVSGCRRLAETYSMHLARGDLGRSDHVPDEPTARPSRRLRRDAGRRWIVPQRWDSWLASTLAPLLDNDPAQIGSTPPPAGTSSHTVLLEAVWGKTDTHLLPEHLRDLATAARAIVGHQDEAGALDNARQRLDDLLRTWIPSAKTRLDAIDRLVRRMFLIPLRDMLYRFVYDAPQLKLAGVSAAEEIASALGGYDAWRAVPHGPLGRLVFAFTEDVNTDAPQNTRLSAVAFGGDPHRYITDIGQTTALAHAGHRRIVLGLSATAYLPGAHRHHVHTKPSFVVPDEGSEVVIDLRAIPGENTAELLRISGLSGKKRRQATYELGKRLWSELKRELEQLQATNPKGIQDTILLATTSYVSCHDLADGLTDAGASPGLLAVAVRPDPDPNIATTVRQRHWTEIPADQLEDFGGMPQARILIAPIQRAERSLNILAPGEHRSRIGSIWLAVRPMSIVDEPDELLAHVGARALDDRRAYHQPWTVLAEAKATASAYFDELLAGERYFKALPKRAKLAITAELVASIIQLVGRARRGGTPGRLHLVDAAFVDGKGNSDLPTLLRELRAAWRRSGELGTVVATNKASTDGFFTFADQHAIHRADLDTVC